MELIILVPNQRVLQFTIQDWDQVPDDAIEIVLNPKEISAKDLTNTLEYHNIDVIDFGIHPESCGKEFIRIKRADISSITHQMIFDILTIQF